MFTSNNSDNGVTLWLDGKRIDKLGAIGFFSKKRGLVLSTLFTFAVMGTPWWWPTNSNRALTFSLESIVFTSALIALAFVFLAIWYTHIRTKRSLALKSGLHQLAHEVREAICETIERLPRYENGLTNNDLEHEHKHLVGFSNSASAIIREYFKQLVKDEQIICSIRLTYQDPLDPESDPGYKTFGRAGPYNKGRERNSEPVMRSVGLPKFFLESECQGVLFVQDLSKAVSSGVCVLTKNDEKYREDVMYKAVSPIFGWSGQRMDLLGLLYITSPNKKILNRVHVDLYRFTSDLLAGSYSSILSLLETADSTPRPTRHSVKPTSTEPTI